MNIQLSDIQKKSAIELFKSTTDLNELTRVVFNNDLLDGRSKEGRALRSFMIENKLEFKTTRREKAPKVTFTPDDKKNIIRLANEGLSSLAIAQVIFPDREVKPLSAEMRTVLGYILEVNPDYSPSKDASVGISNYVSPKSTSRIIKKINDATGGEIIEEKLTRQVKVCIERLGINLNNSRFIIIVNNYTKKDDRDLFEQEFIRLTWDKPDLTSDELNLYMNVCKEIVNLETISKHINRLNNDFDIAGEASELTIRLAETIKVKSGEYHQCETRIENLTKKLQGDRSQRLQNKHQENGSILALVQSFQDETERQNMIRMAEMQNDLVKGETDRLENMEEWKCRILGISKVDVI